jgi:hypothetical protein
LGGKDVEEEMNILALLCLMFLASPAYASQMTFEEVKSYLTSTVQLHKPENKSINSEAYDYPAVNIISLWQNLGIPIKPLRGDDDYLFDCEPSQKECFLPYPKADVLEHGNIKIIRISKSIPWDYQYLFFNREGDRYLYFDHLEYNMQKYEEPKLVFLEDDLFYINILNSSGTNTISYVTMVAQITDKKIKELLWYPSLHERSSWGMCFDETINLKQRYAKGVLTLDYDIRVMMNENNYDSKVKGKLPTSPVIHAKKRIVLIRKPEGFVLDKEKSNASLEEIMKLDWGGYSDYYEAFRNEFDALGKRNSKTKEWLQFFMLDLEHSKESKE